MLVAQWMPRNGEHFGPISTGPAVALLGAGGVVVVTAGVAAALTRRERDAGRLTRWLFGLGLSLCFLGGLGLLGRYFEDRQTSDGLHAAGRQIIDEALEAARNCETAAPEPTIVYPSEPGSGGAATYVPSPCSTSPRDALPDPTMVTSHGVYRAQEADSFDTNGHVTVTDPDSGKQVCATVPDTADGSGAVVDGPCGG
ncbi:hypothetical protein ABT173_29625 [Streptomyces sp. NPDC001795]|uniref:hypothetical protein n=1 Tax=unclassified Streptomyces TaxID=2593676 RepID=UPI003322FDE0